MSITNIVDLDVDPPRFSHSVGWVAVGQAAVRSVQIIVTLLFVYILRTSAWNEIAIALSIYLAGVTVGSLNLEHSILFFLPRYEQHDWGKLLSGTLKMLGATGLVAGVGISLSGLFFMEEQFHLPLLLVGIAVFLEIPTVLVGPAFIAMQRSSRSGQWDLFHAVIQFAFLIVPAIVFGSAKSVLIGLVIASALRCISAMFIMKLMGARHTHQFEADMMYQQVKFCIPLGIALAAGVLTRSIDKWLVAVFDFSNVGMYAVAAIEVPLLAVLPYAGGAAIAHQLVSAFLHRRVHEAHQLWLQQAKDMICPVILGAVGLIVVAPELFQLFLPHNYVKVILPFQIFTLISVHRVTEYGLVLRAANRSDLVTQSSIVLLVSNVVFAAIGLKIHGLSGMACGSLAAFGVAWFWMLRKLSKIFCVSVRDVFPWRAWFLTLLVASVVGYAAEIFTRDIGSPLVSLVMKLGAVWGIGFLLINHSSSRKFIKR